jgi:predicted nucleotidyltransferase component of viral defense system
MLHLTTVENNTYLLLKDIFEIEFIKNNFALAGGTSLSLQIGHRTSIDLDIFSTKAFNVKELEIILTTNKKIDFSYSSNNSRMLFGFARDIKCDFVEEPAKLLMPFLEIDGVNYFSVKDIAAMKLHTICGRGKRKDFFDIYALLQLFSWEDLNAWFLDKYSETQMPFLLRSILYFGDADNDPEIDGHIPFDKNWGDIKKFIKKTCG